MNRLLLTFLMAGSLYADDAGGELFRGFGFIGLLLMILIVVVGIFGWIVMGLLSDILEGLKNGFRQ